MKSIHIKEKERYMEFSREDRLLLSLLLHCGDVAGNTGLLHGMTGYAVALAALSRARRLKRLEDVAGMLMEKVFAGVTDVTPPGLGYGLAGIGWGMEYLIQSGFVKGSGAVILGGLDRQLMLTDVGRMADRSLERGLSGILHYVAAHVQGARRQGEDVFDSRYLRAVTDRALLSGDAESRELAECIAGEREYTMDPLRFIDRGRILKRRSDGLKDLSLAGGVAGELLLIMEREGGRHA